MASICPSRRMLDRLLILACSTAIAQERVWAQPALNVPATMPNVFVPTPYVSASEPNVPAPTPYVSASAPNVPAPALNMPAHTSVSAPMPNVPATMPNVSAPIPYAPVAEQVLHRLTLDEARMLAMNNNKALMLARLNVDEKGRAATAAKKDYLPKVIGFDSYFHFNDNLGSVVTVQSGALGILPSLSKSVSVSVLNQDSNLASAMVVQPITKLIAVNAAVQLARAEQGSARAQLDKGTRDLISGVAQAYFALLGAQRIHSALLLQASVLEEGIRLKPMPELRIGLVETRQGIAQVRGQMRDLTDLLNDLLGQPPCTVYELVDPLPAPPPLRCADEAAELAAAHSPEVHEAQQGIAKAEAAMKMARMACLPDVSVMGGYANQTAASYIQPNIGFVGVSANYTFFEWGKRLDVKKQRELDIAMAYQNIRVVMDKVRLDARKAYSHFDQAREEYSLAGELVQAREEAEKAATGLAAVQAKADTAKAELEYLKAEIAYRVAHAQLSSLIGWQ